MTRLGSWIPRLLHRAHESGDLFLVRQLLRVALPTGRGATTRGCSTSQRCAAKSPRGRLHRKGGPGKDVRQLVRQIAAEHELEIISGKVARDHVHVFLSYRPTQRISQIVQWLKGTTSRVLLQELPRLRKQFLGRHFWARGYLAISSGTITDEMVRDYIDKQEGEQIADDSRFLIDDT